MLGSLICASRRDPHIRIQRGANATLMRSRYHIVSTNGRVEHVCSASRDYGTKGTAENLTGVVIFLVHVVVSL